MGFESWGSAVCRSARRPANETDMENHNGPRKSHGGASGSPYTGTYLAMRGRTSLSELVERFSRYGK